MKKLLFFIRSLDAGGAERQLVVAAKALAARDYDVAVLTFYSGGFYADELLDENVRLLSLYKKGRWDLVAFFYRLISILRAEAPDVIYSYLGGANIFSVLARPFIPGVRVVWGVRASNMSLDQYDWVSRLSYRIECKLSHLADQIVANSHAGLAYAVEQGFPEQKLIVITNGIDTERFRPDELAGRKLRRMWGVDENEYLIGLVGRIDPMKGHPIFLEAAALVRGHLENVRFVCVGKGESEYENAMHKLTAELGLGDVLVWAGLHSNMMEVYNALNIATSSSYGEGFPNVVGEAMSCGIPCVVTDVGDSALVAGQAGLVVPPDDSAALCAAWIEMLSMGATKFHGTSVAARDRIVTEYNTDKMVNAMEHMTVGDGSRLSSYCRENANDRSGRSPDG